MLADPTTFRSHHPTRARPLALVVSLLAVAAVALIGRGWTDTAEGSWYDGLDKPAWTPPGPTFGIVWTILYASMAAAAWLVWRRGPERADVRRAIVSYAVQLVLNVGWTATFFALERPGWAILEITALVVAVAITLALSWRVDRVAGWLLMPYLAWAVYATSLTVGIAAMN